MIPILVWKEWHENRSKYLSYWLIMNAPVLLLTLAIAVSSGARVPFADLSDANAMKYLPLALSQSILATTLFLLFTGYLAIATFSPEVDDRSLFFFYEQPVPRTRYIAIKLLNGAAHVVLATTCAILLLPIAAYAMMLISGKVSLAGSSGALTLVMAAALRSAGWCALLSLVVFTASALVSALIPRWWLAAACSVLISALFVGAGGEFFNFFPQQTAEPMSVGVSVSSNDSHWVTVSRAVKPDELAAFANWRPWPILTAAILTATFCLVTIWLYNRKELR